MDVNKSHEYIVQGLTLNKRKAKHIVICGAISGLLAGAINILFTIQIYGQLSFHLGQTISILCMLVFGFRAGLFSALIMSTLMAYAWNNPFLVLLLGLEISVLYYLKHRGLTLLSGAFVYWLFIGIPITYVYTSLVYDLAPDYSILLLAKQLVNGVLYTLLAGIIFMLLPNKYLVKAYNGALPSISNRIFYLLNMSIILPSLIVAIVFTARTTSNIQKQVEIDLNASANEINYQLESHLETHQKVVRKLALSIGNSEQASKLLSDSQFIFDGFLTMLQTDEEGTIVFGAPESFYKNLENAPPAQRHVRDRDYYSVPRTTLKPYISDAFVGRGFGNDIIVAISAPIIKNSRFAGIVEGSLNLPNFSHFERPLDESSAGNLIVITDSNNNVVYASNELNLGTLSAFTPNTFVNRYVESVELTQLDGQEYLFAKQTNIYNWNSYVLIRPKAITRLFYENLLLLIATLAIITGIFLAITKRFTHQIIKPLVLLTKVFNNENSIDVESINFRTKEVDNIATDLLKAKGLMEGFNKELEQKVEQKTSELSQLNDELNRLARQDELTQLDNRRAFNEQAQKIYGINSRNRQDTTLVTIDIDNFKSINDTHGHPFGDHCIIKLAALIEKHFNRSSDVCARYGGEEFVLLLASGDCQAHLDKLEFFRQALEASVVVKDDTQVELTVSIGAVCIEKNFDYTFNELMKKADALLYQSKENGRNRITYESV